MAKPSIKYTYARDEAGGLRHISAANHTDLYTCVGCGLPIRPRLGKVRKPHFYDPKAVCSGETYLHNLAKERIC